MPLNEDILQDILDGINQLPRKHEIDTPTNNIDELASHEHDGLMSKEDKEKLDAIEAESNKYILPVAAYGTVGGVTTIDPSTDTDDMIPTPIVNGVPYYHDTIYTLPIASDSELGGVKIGKNVSIAADGTISVPDVSTDVLSGILPVNKGGTNASTIVNARKNLNTMPYITVGNITTEDVTNNGLYQVFEISQTANTRFVIKMIIANKTADAFIVDLVFVSDATYKYNPIVLINGPSLSKYTSVLDKLYVCQLNTAPYGKIQLWYKNPLANTPIKFTILQVTSNYSTDEFDKVVFNATPNTSADSMDPILTTVTKLSDAITNTTASQSEPGYMSNADKTRLDGLDTSISNAFNNAYSAVADNGTTTSTFDANYGDSHEYFDIPTVHTVTFSKNAGVDPVSVVDNNTVRHYFPANSSHNGLMTNSQYDYLTTTLPAALGDLQDNIDDNDDDFINFLTNLNDALDGLD